MPKLVNRPPKYRHHKSNGQAIVSIDGRDIQLGVFGSPRSYERYDELVEQWRRRRDEARPDLAEQDPESVSGIRKVQRPAP
ncbi:hypothetical protein Mal64_06420 [Pseudobythopirellula maris]|uniref:Uncharacterized protein n=1 Tax=Pseudobythopirellula maris TaxID=2527991 RepID=A0A5C5ZT89_9BACT|nr:hypothetical protein [Pseudobythopirellula maris]TWT90257.1 hypothetical protein Mal64_06420 [Pseudobythopirellula maris]